MGIIPLWWSVISELYGRRPVYLISFAIFLVWNIVSAESTSLSMLIVMRVLCGGASASVQAVGAGTVADLWEVERRGQAMGYFFLGPMVGPLISPILGGILTEKLGWRATQWATVVYGAIVWLLILFCLPETSFARKSLTREQSPDASPNDVNESFTIIRRICRIFLEPFKVLTYLQFPPVLLTVYYASSTFACYYAVSITLQTMFSDAPYFFSPIIVGLVYIPCALGSITASLLGGRWTDHIMRRRAKSSGRFNVETGQIKYLPGDRMGENAWLASLVYPAASLWFGWTIDKGVFWLCPVSSVLLNCLSFPPFPSFFSSLSSERFVLITSPSFVTVYCDIFLRSWKQHDLQHDVDNAD
jgi:multidrug resistance protein